MPRLSPMEIYRKLPGINCKKCGVDTCMAFASKLIERAATPDDCPPLDEEKYRKKKEDLIKLLAPPVKEVVIGAGEKTFKIGGEEVMYRHELTYFNSTGLFYDVDCSMPADELIKRVKEIEGFGVEKIGKVLRFDGIAVRCKTGDATNFGETVLTVSETSTLPMVLCSYDPELLEVGVGIALDKRPLLYAATPDNWEKVSDIAKRHSCPVVASAPGDIQRLLELSRNLNAAGIEDIVLDIGTSPLGDGFADTINNLAVLRRLAIEDQIPEAMYPLLGVPMVSWIGAENDIDATYEEATLAASLLLRYCDILILHSTEVWSNLPLLTLRLNIYTDPRVPVSVESKLYVVGKPNETAPVFLTTNFALTYFTVASDLESAKIPSYILVADTEGLAVEVSMAGKKITPDVIQEIFEKSKIEEKVKHKKLIIPGVSARIKGEIEDATGWEVIVGPKDSSQILGFIQKNWNP
ncbi:MAG: acetyl-CoA decarbonylase/synthase complex subunit gamma [Candidatus Hydrothermarchaeales archaeon]